jgi:hypothetical protein
MSLAHKWEFTNMTRAAFKAYVALADVEPADKIAMRGKYDLPREYLLEPYKKICTRSRPPSMEEGRKIGGETMALIGQTREELNRYQNVSESTQYTIVTNNLIDLKPSYFYSLKARRNLLNV